MSEKTNVGYGHSAKRSATFEGRVRRVHGAIPNNKHLIDRIIRGASPRMLPFFILRTIVIRSNKNDTSVKLQFYLEGSGYRARTSMDSHANVESITEHYRSKWTFIFGSNVNIK